MTQRDAIAHAAHLTIDIAAAGVVVDAVAVAHVEPVLGAVPPYPVLHEPREGFSETRVELPGINPVSDHFNDIGAATASVATGAITVVGIEPAQNATANHKVVDQRIDGDHAGANLSPESHALGRSQQQDRQGHAEHFVRDPVNVSERVKQPFAHSTKATRVVGLSYRSQLTFDPADEIVAGDVTHEQV